MAIVADQVGQLGTMRRMNPHFPVTPSRRPPQMP